MSATLAIRQETWAELVDALFYENETAGFLLAGIAEDPGQQTLLCRTLHWIPEEGYQERTSTSLSISSSGFMPSLAAAARDSAVPVFVHTHPGGAPSPSTRDDLVDEELRSPAQIRSSQNWYGSLILGGTRDDPTFTGRLWDRNGNKEPISRIRVVGRNLQILAATDSRETQPEIRCFDRHIRAFGDAGQQLLSRLRVGVVGAGATGSAVAEQLTRLGVGELVLVDDDTVDDGNLTRIHESTRADVGRLKVDVLKDAVDAIGLGTSTIAIDGRITGEANVMPLRHCDAVFGCTDDQRGRAILSRLAIWYLIPTFDMGFVVDSSEDNRINGLYGRVTTLRPGAACLLCRERINPDTIRNEGLHVEERNQLADEGYVPGLDEPDPSVGAFTTMTAMFAINTMLECIFNYSPEVGASTELLINVHELKLRRNSRAGTAGHFCANPEKWGRGDTSPLLETTW